MSATASALSTINPIVVYAVLGFYGILIAAVLLYVYHKFSGANRLLNSLKQDWESAETTHTHLLNQAKDHVSKIASSAHADRELLPASRSVTFDTRNQVIGMGRRGLSAADIARACAMPEADVDVLLGLARLQR